MILLFVVIVIASVPAFFQVKIIENNIEIIDFICPEKVQNVSENILAGIIIPAYQKDV